MPLALTAKAGRAVAIGRRGRHDVEPRILEQSAIGNRARLQALDEHIVLVALGGRRDQRREIDRDQRSVDIAGRIGGEILDRAGRADRRAGKVADRQPVDLQQPLAQPQRRIHRLRRQAGRADRPGLDLQVEIAVGEAVHADIADEQRSEGREPVDVERTAGKLEHGRRLGVARLPALRFAAEGRAAEPEFEIAEDLALAASGRPWRENRRRAAA